MNDIKVDFCEIKLPSIEVDEIKSIDNNLDLIIDEFIKRTIKDKDLYIAQHIMKKQRKKEQLLIKYLEDSIKSCQNDLKKLGENYNVYSFEINDAKARLSAYKNILERLKSDKHE